MEFYKRFTEAVAVNNSVVRASLSWEKLSSYSIVSNTDDRLAVETRYFSEVILIFLFSLRKISAPSIELFKFLR